jgi:hypothetical protein
MRGICRSLAGLSLLLPFMASPAMAQVCGTNGNQNNVEFAIVTGTSAPQQLLCARENSPQTTRTVGTITGLQNGETVISIDYNAQNNTLVALSSGSKLYTIGQNAAATLLATLATNGQPVNVQAGGPFEADFNPTNGALRIINSQSINLRVTPPITGGATVADTTLSVAGAAAGSPAPQGVNTAAYTNNDTSATTGTTLFVVDTTLNTLAIQSPPNNGLLVSVGALGVDVGPNTFLDIYTRLPTGNQPQTNRALIAYQVTGQPFQLAAEDLTTGQILNPRAFATNVTPVAFAVPTLQGTQN